ncbi:protein translocase subunit SecF [Magnetovibrio blakemorei]|uniref:Protein-export membrane protein SecF n=1 Tax=Magnetovibrio blakemorei TaxID=28181 RepID=A0A1E5QAC6_9PROT|nr:protein translocase subunit SecF [Magnetovibrio blakemorei]OEJ68882.1 protein-export membrane protein SecF [Magnetovibrio blakemorei]
MRIKLLPENPNYAFLSKRMIFYVFSSLLVASSIAMFSIKGLSYGIDFTGGIMIEVKMSEPDQIGSMRSTLSQLGLGAVELQEFGTSDDIMIRLQAQDGGEAANQAAVNAVKKALGDGVEYRRTELVGPKVSDELFLNGIYAVVSAIMAILIYIWFRFEWQFGLSAVVALAHDVISTIGVFSLIQHEFNLTTVAAVLTIAGYSINDTVVVFDRVRENLRKYKTMPMEQLLNQSVNETLSRTTMTSFTTLLALVALYYFGGEIIRDFAFAMIWGILIGTYSSICVAVPMLLHMSVERRSGEDDQQAQEQQS